MGYGSNGIAELAALSSCSRNRLQSRYTNVNCMMLWFVPTNKNTSTNAFAQHATSFYVAHLISEYNIVLYMYILRQIILIRFTSLLILVTFAWVSTVLTEHFFISFIIPLSPRGNSGLPMFDGKFWSHAHYIYYYFHNIYVDILIIK